MQRAAIAAGLCAVAACGSDRTTRPKADPPERATPRAPTRSPLAEAPAPSLLAEAPPGSVEEELAALDTVLLTVDVSLHAIRLGGDGSAGHPPPWPTWLDEHVVADADAALTVLGRSADRALAQGALEYQVALAGLPRLRAMFTPGDRAPWSKIEAAVAAITDRGAALHAAAAARAAARPTAADHPGTVVASCGRIAGLAARIATVPVPPPPGTGTRYATAEDLTAAGLACLAACDAYAHAHPSGPSLTVVDWGVAVSQMLLAEGERLRSPYPRGSRMFNAAQEATYFIRAVRGIATP